MLFDKKIKSRSIILLLLNDNRIFLWDLLSHWYNIIFPIQIASKLILNYFLVFLHFKSKLK